MPDSDGALLITKLLPAFVYPLGFTLLLMIASGTMQAIGRGRAAGAIICVASTGLWIAATPTFSEWCLQTLERQYPPRAISDLPPADVAIVLGGAIGGAVPPRVTSDLSASSDRVLHAARLYRAGRVKRVLVTGGSLPWSPAQVPEAILIRELLIEWGVPDSAVEIAAESRNTFENALEIVKLRQHTPFMSALLVTSAWHMPRAMAVFHRAGIPVVAATTDVAIVWAGPWTPLRWMPDAAALNVTTLAVKEWIGTIGYRLRGYI